MENAGLFLNLDSTNRLPKCLDNFARLAQFAIFVQIHVLIDIDFVDVQISGMELGLIK